MKNIVIFLLAILLVSSCRTYYAGYGKGQARHRKCGQRNMNSRLFGEAVPVDSTTTFVVQP